MFGFGTLTFSTKKSKFTHSPIPSSLVQSLAFMSCYVQCSLQFANTSTCPRTSSNAHEVHAPVASDEMASHDIHLGTWYPI
mmetsp:Transcript_10566/g.6296  ORF Transcript_10566/g.6296 Transcript_10566/m.6296 type:complete len:81 (-) Transcript_10566:42-284(-)